MDDKTLSTYAHNVKVVAQNGQVTLKGPVRTEDEKRKSVEARPQKWRALDTSPMKSPLPRPRARNSSQGASHE